MDNKGPAVTQQPMGQAQPAYQYTEKSAGGDTWNNDLFDCFNGPDMLCLKGTFCPCFVHGKTAHRLRDPSMTGYSGFNSDCLIWCGLQSCCGVGWIFSVLSRGEARTKFGIQGSGAKDCLAAFCCTCCSLIQVEKEVIGRTSAPAGGYVAPNGMVAQPQN